MSESSKESDPIISMPSAFPAKEDQPVAYEASSLTIAVVAGESKRAQKAKKEIESKYKTVPLDEASVIIALGGDGIMLHTLRDNVGSNAAIYGMNRGTVGFLMNEYSSDALLERLNNALCFRLHPLRMRAKTLAGDTLEAIAINEVSLFRETRQAAKL
ncbi:MAG: hypothetical protein R3261_12465, partial [Alphaproteobacteria bacterium]|nr:hypothetical protein [Alphaproteobacteria bacterium]